MKKCDQIEKIERKSMGRCADDDNDMKRQKVKVKVK